MATVSKMVANRVAITRTVTSSVEVHGAEIAGALTAILFPGGPPPNLTVEVFLDALRATLARSVEEMTDADLAHAQELADDEAPRLARDGALLEVREQLIGVRATLGAVYGPSLLTAYGLSGDTPQDAELLLQRAANTVSLLRSRPITEKPRQAGVTVDAVALADALEAPAKKLGASLADVRREEREAQLTMTRRNTALERWSARYQGVADIITGCYEAVGRSDLADIVRPTSRRRAGLTEEVDAQKPV